MQYTLGAFKQRTNVIKIVRLGLVQSRTSSTTTTVSLIVYMWNISFSIKSQRNVDQVRWRHNISCGAAIILAFQNSANRKEYIYIYVILKYIKYLEIQLSTQGNGESSVSQDEYHKVPWQLEQMFVGRTQGFKREGFPTHLHCQDYFKWRGLRSFKKSMNLGLGVIYPSNMSSVVLLKQKNSSSLKCFQPLACY